MRCQLVSNDFDQRNDDGRVAGLMVTSQLFNWRFDGLPPSQQIDVSPSAPQNATYNNRKRAPGERRLDVSSNFKTGPRSARTLGLFKWS